MKKVTLILFISILSILLCGCEFEDPKYISFSKKPNNSYYTDELHKKILSENSYTLYVFDNNLYKEIKVSPEESIIIENLINSLTAANYLKEEINEEEPFRLKIVFDDNQKYLIKVFNSSNISISPWDGNYSEDVISMEDVPLNYNLYDFCNHILNKPLDT